MSSKIGLNLTRNYSINFDLKKRDKKSIKFIIIHYTGMKNESDAIKRLCNSKSEVSSHYFIKNNGDLLNLVPDLYNAWHSGKSSWKKFKSLNRYSIGIEINNPGHEFKYKKYSLKQISSLIKLLKVLKKKYKIKKQNILGHSDISPNRKKDPGEKFPWNKLARKKLCKWHTLDENKIKIYRNLKLNNNDEKLFLNNLSQIGYSKIFSTKYRIKKINLVKAFQRRYRQSLINGKIDKECLVISQNLLKN
ncbi:N-acetylmuramoyl-L-alanine amidase [Candidatus Pelagibacter sp.]|nr:N-acetylmuramoyl-L-alanine amidase [Candidatus Pelagibacter sp.]|tara:strand:+ start:352 stop:1095 length:744 start_codon:yes stop_codon:yes gene_type:complete